MPGVRLPHSPWSLGFVALFFLVVGGGLLTFTLPTLRDAYRTHAWPKVTGQVVTSDVRQRGKGFAVDVSFQYAVAGRWHHGWGTVRARHYQAAIRRHPAGASIDVHYDPHQSARSVLPTSADVELYVAAIMGMVLVTLGAHGLVVAIRWFGGAPPPRWFGTGGPSSR